MRYVEDKGCYNNGPATHETPNSSSTMIYSEFHKGNDAVRVSSHHPHHHRTSIGKPTPSKWDDAQKWLAGLSSSKGVEKKCNQSSKSSKPRNSSADDLRLIAPVPQKEQDYSSSEKEEEEEQNGCHAQFEAETKKVECDESIWRVNYNYKNSENAAIPVFQSICFRDMGTEMTPIASQEPSRTATPIRATSPIHSGTSTPIRGQNGSENVSGIGNGTTISSSPCKVSSEKKIEGETRKLSPLESRAMAWEEAERTKYMARFKREEVKIQAWENHEIRKAEMEMKKMEVKAERMKAWAQERLANKLATTKRIAEEKRANAQVRLNEKALRTTEKADYRRRTGHVPASFSFNFNFKFPSICSFCR